jgi:DNA-binding CsgD family transcriptional regulator
MAGDAVAAPEKWLGRAGVTEREAEVLSALAGRRRNREIASQLHISVRTVESHIAALLRKLGVADRMALALRIAETGGGPFPDGIRFTDLAPVGPELVGDTLARALGVVPPQGWPLREILREVAHGLHCLLLVDNCEHVVAEVAEIAADLLAAGSRLRVLATSREPLGIPGEATYQVRTHMRPAEAPDGELRRSLAHTLGTATFHAACQEGERLAPAQALQRSTVYGRKTWTHRGSLTPG